ncbi:MAG: hypothetical protein ACK4PI_12730 [Tepidisphaerales bacterium]
MGNALGWLFSRTLNNVWFGIVMMVLVALYVAIGSGLPSVREYFEMDELGFFNAWPLKVLMGLLVANLVVVTFVRIPFTPPRYGVWMIHAGIVTLIFGMAYYYTHKEEGLTLVMRGGSVSHYYDRWERGLYVRVDGVNTGDMLPLVSLPRFAAYPPNADGTAGPIRRVGGRDLSGLRPVVMTRTASAGGDGSGAAGGAAGSGVGIVPLHQMLGLPEPIRFDVVGYWPYAEIVRNYTPGLGNAGRGSTGMLVEAFDARGEAVRRFWLVGEEPGAERESLGELELEHRHLPSDEAADQTAEAVGRMHVLEVATADGVAERRFVQVGDTFDVGPYTIAVEAFDPRWTTMQGETVPLLTLMVTPRPGSGLGDGGQPFRRQLISGRERVTDWRLNQPGAGPMGVRQSEPLDAKLITRYTFSDSLRLLPREGSEKRLFITSPGRTWIVGTSTTRPGRATRLDSGEVEMVFGSGDDRAVVRARRGDGLVRSERVVEVPREQRDRRVGEAGTAQVVAVRVSMGDWSTLVHVPYAQWAVTNPGWKGGFVTLPTESGAGRTIQLQLGNRLRPIAPDRWGRPATVRLDRFELVSYAGGTPTSGLQRDFKSYVTITEPNGRVREDVAHMNNPIYFGGTPLLNLGDTYWTLFQAQWDPNGQRFTVLGVGNRPGVWVMTAGSVIMTVGLLYAFYAKPLIIRRMKERALAEAKAKGKAAAAATPDGLNPAVARRSGVVMEGMEGRVSI